MHWGWLGVGVNLRALVRPVGRLRHYTSTKTSAFTQQQRDEARHLLRAILREATYFPDELVREYIKRYAVDRFRDYRIGQKSNCVLAERRDDAIDKAKKQIRTLIRANAGELKTFHKVLLLAYGRSGRRRHELLRPLVEIPDEAPGGDKQEDRQLHKDAQNKRDPALDCEIEHSKDTTTQLHTLNNKILALLKTGIGARKATHSRVSIKHHGQLEPRIPKLNSWSKPMPENRIRNKTRKWYGNMLDQVLPPLPDHEYDRVKALALGRLALSRLPKPRQPASRTDVMSAVERSTLVAKRELLEKVRGHTFTPRFLQRQYAHVFLQVPKMEWNGEYKVWMCDWGGDVLARQARARLTLPSKSAARSKVSKTQ